MSQTMEPREIEKKIEAGQRRTTMTTETTTERVVLGEVRRTPWGGLARVLSRQRGRAGEERTMYVIRWELSGGTETRSRSTILSWPRAAEGGAS
jgi:hypothetical protein